VIFLRADPDADSGAARIGDKSSPLAFQCSTAAEVSKELLDLMVDVKERPSKTKLHGVKKKRGPTKQH
jgi:hypothetical protein